MANTDPAVGWICTDPLFLLMAEAMLDERYDHHLLKSGDTNMYRLGRIGSSDVVINCLQEPFHTADAVHIAQEMAIRFGGIKAILMTGFGSEIPSTGIRLGDLLISPTMVQCDGDAHLNSTPTPSIVQHAAHILQREVGQDGWWLSRDLDLAVSNFPELLKFSQRPDSNPPDYPLLHYGKIGSGNQDIKDVKLRDQMAASKNTTCFDTVAAGIKAFSIYEITKCF